MFLICIFFRTLINRTNWYIFGWLKFNNKIKKYSVGISGPNYGLCMCQLAQTVPAWCNALDVSYKFYWTLMTHFGHSRVSTRVIPVKTKCCAGTPKLPVNRSIIRHFWKSWTGTRPGKRIMYLHFGEKNNFKNYIFSTINYLRSDMDEILLYKSMR